MTKSIDVDIEVPAARLIAGVSVPDSPLITEVLEYAQKLYEPISSTTPCDRGCSQRRSES